MSPRQAAFSLLCLFLASSPSAALAARPKRTAETACRVAGIAPLKEYLLPADRECFVNARAAEAKGYASFKSGATKRAHTADACGFVAPKGAAVYYPRRAVKCFTSRKAAESHGYTHYVQVTPTPVSTGGTMTYDVPPTAIPTAVPTAIPTISTTPGASAISYPRISLWRSQVVNGVNEGYEVGTCSATLSADRTTVTLGCQYDYPDVTELHLHLPPDNTEYCPAPSPLSPVAPYTCTIPPEIAAGIEAGKVFVMIHSGPIGEGEMITASGYF